MNPRSVEDVEKVGLVVSPWCRSAVDVERTSSSGHRRAEIATATCTGRPPWARLMRAIGLMSGTSMDGIDVALIETDGEDHVARGPGAHASPIPDAFRAQLRASLDDAAERADRTRPARLPGQRRAGADRRCTPRPSRASSADQRMRACAVDVDRLPRPDRAASRRRASRCRRPRCRAPASSRQLGDGAALAERPASTSSTTCAPPTCRRRPGRAAGAGLSPRAGGRAAAAAGAVRQHRRRRQRHLDRPRRRADRLRHRPRQRADRRLDAAPHRRAARSGRRAGRHGPACTSDYVAEYLRHSYFGAAAAEVARPQRLPARAGRAAVACRRRGHADRFHRRRRSPGRASISPSEPQLWIISGGGRRNKTLMSMIAGARRECRGAGRSRRASTATRWRRKPGPISPCARSQGLPITFPGTTGAPRPLTGGVLARAK